MGSPPEKSGVHPGGGWPGEGLWLDAVIGLKACPSVRAGGDKVSLCDCRGVGVFALAVGGLGVCADEEDP